MDLPFSRGRAAWVVAGLVAAVVVAWVVASYVGTFVFGVFLYYVARPAHRRLRNRLRPSIAAATAIGALAVPVVLLVGYTLAVAAQELDRLAQAVDLGPLADRVEPYLDVSEIVQDPAMLLRNPDVVDAGQLLAEGVLDYIPLVGTALVNLFLALAVAFYLLRDGPRLGRWLRGTFGNGTGTFDAYVHAVDEDLGSVYFGNILNAFVVAIVAVVLYTVLNAFAPATGIPYPALVGVLAGAASLIPVVGMKLVYVPVAVGLFARAVVADDPLWFPTAFVVLTVVFVDLIPDVLLRPYVSGRNLHVGLVMIAYVLGPLLFGWYGLFLGPLVLVVVFHFARIVLPTLVAGGRPTTPPPHTEPADHEPAEPDTAEDPTNNSPESDPA
ncbi:AI-2E family transporter [Halomicroarcula sp. F13]|uniref:AI-2E family transporter n=1 Tax=Haloarcula rubra TaxID=2487747 RepID=A0AAW4PRY2_9EURY|nr:AI-2E family transporter [Halomicroarcula rubra]MBX0323439.1 AI-2E family transporter [Halomicroarcula rubra]